MTLHSCHSLKFRYIEVVLLPEDTESDPWVKCSGGNRAPAHPHLNEFIKAQTPWDAREVRGPQDRQSCFSV